MTVNQFCFYWFATTIVLSNKCVLHANHNQIIYDFSWSHQSPPHTQDIHFQALMRWLYHSISKIFKTIICLTCEYRLYSQESKLKVNTAAVTKKGDSGPKTSIKASHLTKHSCHMATCNALQVIHNIRTRTIQGITPVVHLLISVL